MTNKKKPRLEKVQQTLRVAVTGGAGSGKTSVCNHLKSLGLNVISTDRIAREVVSPGSPVLRAIVARFGDAILKPDGTLDRLLLREEIVKDKYKKQILEDIIHPAILKRMHEMVDDARQSQEPIVVVEVPLLFELDLADVFDLVVMVTTSRKRKIERMAKRDGVSRKSAEALLRLQLPDSAKVKQSDIIIKNDGSPEDLKASVQAVYHALIQKSVEKP
jgi:dephospho-CoA kinase